MSVRWVTVLAGVLSGVVVWAGMERLPAWPPLRDAYPGLVFGLFLFALCGWTALASTRARLVALGVSLVASVASWRLAVSPFAHWPALPFVLSGALGGAVVGAGCAAMWRSRALQVTASLTAAGLLGGVVFQLLDPWLHTFGEHVWSLGLLIEWQTLVLVTATWLRHRAPR